MLQNLMVVLPLVFLVAFSQPVVTTLWHHAIGSINQIINHGTESLSKVSIESADGAELMRAAIQDIAVGPDRGRDISQDHAQAVMQSILLGELDEVQTAIFLIALRMKRETLEEFLGLFSALATNTQTATADVEDVVCLADPFDGYLRNATITPFIPFVLAVNGLNALMHGVESVGPKHGVTAHKVYKMAGANIALAPIDAAAKLADLGVCYTDQRQYSPALFALQDLRHRIVKRSAITTLERMLIPVRGRKSTSLILGYVHKAYPDIYARVAFSAGYDSVLLLKGVEGGLAPALNKPLRRFVFKGRLPDDVDAAKQVINTPFSEQAGCAAQAMRADTGMVEQCLEQGLEALNGKAGLARESLTLACAQVLNAYDSELSFTAAVEKVQACLDNGSALERFRAFVL